MITTLNKVHKPLTLSKLLSRAQREFNRFIVRRDLDSGCISCGAMVTEAGHYFSAGHHSKMRFSEVNTNGQCTKCNMFLHGNLIHYRNGLIRRYGQQKLDLLESTATRNRVHRWSRGELEIIYRIYKEKNSHDNN